MDGIFTCKGLIMQYTVALPGHIATIAHHATSMPGEKAWIKQTPLKETAGASRNNFV